MTGITKFYHRLARVDPYLLACIVCAFLLFQPLLAAGLPNTSDGQLHLYRAALYRWSWADGVWWPRWHTLLHQGYGYPLMNFTPPLQYALVALLSLITPNFLVAFKGILLLACLNYTVGMYHWARPPLGPTGALIAAVAYTFAPYRFRELYFQGNYGQFLAWSLYPWILYFFQRLIQAPQRRYLLGATLSYAALLLTHNISTLLFTPLLGAYILWLTILNAKTQRRKDAGFSTTTTFLALFYPALAVLGSIGLAAVYLLPALGENATTQVQALTQGFFDVGSHFVRWRELLASTPLLDERATNPPMPFNFGSVHLALLGLGALSLFYRVDRRNHRAQSHLVFALLLGGLFTFLLLPATLPIWRALPPLAFVEFPTRCFGVILLCTAFVAGGASQWLPTTPRWRMTSLLVLICALMVAVAPYQFPRPFLQPQLTPTGYLAYEQRSNTLGTTSADEFLPRWVVNKPTQPAATSADGLQRVPINPAVGLTVQQQLISAQAINLSVTASTANTVTIDQFYFPGWLAWVDDTAVAVTPAPQSGLIQVNVPAGQHDVVLRFVANTPLRRAGAWLSLLTLIGIVGEMAFFKRLSKSLPIQTGLLRRELSGFQNLTALPTALFLLLLAAKLWWITPYTTWFRLSSPPGMALPASHATDLAITNDVKLIGYDLDTTTLHPGDELPVRLYWQATRPIPRLYSSFVQLITPINKAAIAQADAQNPGGIPTSDWHTSLYVVDELTIRLPLEAATLPVRAMIGLYDAQSGLRLGDTELPIWLHILPQQPAMLPANAQKMTGTFGDRFTLVGYQLQTLVEQTATLPSELEVKLYWQSNAPVTVDYQVFVQALAADGSIVAQVDGPPGAGLFPTTSWLPGQLITDSRRLPFARTAGSKQPVTLLIGLYDLATLARLPTTGADGQRLADDVVRLMIADP